MLKKDRITQSKTDYPLDDADLILGRGSNFLFLMSITVQLPIHVLYTEIKSPVSEANHIHPAV
jgi:hypothetical protein